MFGKGYLAITFDQADTGERYQGIVPLDGDSLSEAAEHYFLQSEQIPTLIRVGTGALGQDGRVAGGLLLQHLPEGEDGRDRIHTRLDHPEWEHVAILGGTMKPEELADSKLSLETLVWRLFNEENRGPRPGRDAVRPRLPLLARLHRVGACEISARGTARHGGRGRDDRGRLRVLRAQVPGARGARDCYASVIVSRRARPR